MELHCLSWLMSAFLVTQHLTYVISMSSLTILQGRKSGHSTSTFPDKKTESLASDHNKIQYEQGDTGNLVRFVGNSIKLKTNQVGLKSHLVLSSKISYEAHLFSLVN